MNKIIFKYKVLQFYEKDRYRIKWYLIMRGYKMFN